MNMQIFSSFVFSSFQEIRFQSISRNAIPSRKAVAITKRCKPTFTQIFSKYWIFLSHGNMFQVTFSSSKLPEIPTENILAQKTSHDIFLIECSNFSFYKNINFNVKQSSFEKYAMQHQSGRHNTKQYNSKEAQFQWYAHQYKAASKPSSSNLGKSPYSFPGNESCLVRLSLLLS